MEGASLVPWWLSLATQGKRKKKKHFLYTTVLLLSFLRIETTCVLTILLKRGRSLSPSEDLIRLCDCISYAYLSLDSADWKGISFTLAAITNSNYSRTSRRVWGDKEGVIWLCVLRRSKSSDIWRLCRVSVGLSLDYG
ncbi:hypothetical protein GmHk_06G017817 [Glycine max]|nr:hypothetical protein GmHk_06G017817 [Glycine max]